MRDLPLSHCTVLTTGQLLTQNCRLDGRQLHEYREISFLFPPSKPTSNGCKGGRCITSVGGTKVLATVTLSIGPPHPRHPAQGTLFVSLDKTSLPSSGPGSLGGTHVRLQEILKQCLRDCLDLDPLCIVAGERVFNIRLELRILCNAGNVLDCAAMAALVSLATFRRPEVSMGPEREIIIHVDWAQHDPVPLTFRRFPFLMTLGLLAVPLHSNAGDAAGRRGRTKPLAPFVLDPTLTEEAILAGRLVVGMNVHRELCALHVLESAPLAADRILSGVKLAEKCVKGLHAILRQALKAYDENEMKPVISKELPVSFSSLDLVEATLFQRTVEDERRQTESSVPLGYQPTRQEDMDISDNDEGTSADVATREDMNFHVAEVATKAPLKTSVWQANTTSVQHLESEEVAVAEYDPAAVVPVLDDSEEEGEVVEF